METPNSWKRQCVVLSSKSRTVKQKNGILMFFNGDFGIGPMQGYIWFVNDMTLCSSAVLPFITCAFSSSNNFLTFPECPENATVEAESEDDIAASQNSLERPAPNRGNTMVLVCWHRNTSVSMVDFSKAVEVPATPQPCSSPLASLFPFSVSDCVLCPNSLGLFLSENGILLCCNTSS